jgi:hypothetical protein
MNETPERRFFHPKSKQIPFAPFAGKGHRSNVGAVLNPCTIMDNAIRSDKKVGAGIRRGKLEKRHRM